MASFSTVVASGLLFVVWSPVRVDTFTLSVKTFTAQEVSADFGWTRFGVVFGFKGVKGRAARFTTALVARFEVLDQEVVGSPRGEEFDSLFERQLVSWQEL